MTLQGKISVHKLLFIQILLVALYGIIVLLGSWISDDAYHSFIMAKNLVDGEGLVYNIGYRVTASTCPLFTLLEAFIYFFIRKMFLVGILLGVFFWWQCRQLLL